MQRGRIYKKGPRWWFRYKAPSIEDGRKVWRDRYINLAGVEDFNSAAAVEKAGLVSRYRTDLDPSRLTPSSTQLVTDFVEKVYLPYVEQTLRPSTVTGYKDFYRRDLKPCFEKRRMHEIKFHTAQQILDAIAKNKPHLSPGALKHLKWLGVSIFDYAAKQGAFDPDARNPFAATSIPRTHHVPVPTRHATLDDVVRMIEVLDEPAATAVATAAFTGLRKSELQGLRWEDLKDNQLYVARTAWRTTTVIDETKTPASEAPVPVIPLLAKYLELHRNGLPKTGFIFAGPKLGKPLDLHNLANRVILPALKAKGIAWCGWHGFRRGLSTTLYELGVDAKTRQAILRHADIHVTERYYTKTVDSVSRAAMAKVQKALDAKLKKRTQP